MQNLLELINDVIIQWKESSSQYQMGLTIMNSCLNSIQLQQQNYANSHQIYKPLNKTNILMVLQQSFQLEDCDRIIKQAANDNNDDKCIQLMEQGFSIQKCCDIQQKNLQFNLLYASQRKRNNLDMDSISILKKKFHKYSMLCIKNLTKQQQLIKSQDSSRQMPKTIFSQGSKLNQSEKKSNSKSLDQESLPKMVDLVQRIIHKEIANQMHEIQDKLIELIHNYLKKVSFSTPKRDYLLMGRKVHLFWELIFQLRGLQNIYEQSTQKQNPIKQFTQFIRPTSIKT